MSRRVFLLCRVAVATTLLGAVFPAARAQPLVAPPTQAPPPREGFLLSGQLGSPLAAAFTPDGRRLLTDSGVVWDVPSGLPICSFPEHTQGISAVALSPDGHRALIGTRDGTIVLWDVARGKRLQTFQDLKRVVVSVAFSPDGRQMLNAWNGLVVVRDVQTGKKLHTLSLQGRVEHTFLGRVEQAAFTPQGPRVLAIFSPSNAVTLLDGRTGRRLHTFQEEKEEYFSRVALSPDGLRVLAVGKSGTLYLWDTRTGARLAAFQVSRHSAVVFSPDGRRVLAKAVFNSDAVTVWNARTGKPLRTFHEKHHRFDPVAFSPDGRRVLLGNRTTGTAELWDISTGRKVRFFGWLLSGIHSTMFSSQGDKVFVITGRDKRRGKGFWLDVRTGKLVRTFQAQNNESLMAFSPDGRWLLAVPLAPFTDTIYLKEARTGKTRLALRHREKASVKAGFSPDGRWVMAQFLFWDRLLSSETILWNLQTGQRWSRFASLRGGERSLGIFHFGGAQVLALASREEVILRDIQSGETLQEFRGPTLPPVALDLSRNGSRMVTSNAQGTGLWDVETGKFLRVLGQGARAVAISPDGCRVLAATGDSVSLWDAESGKLLHTLSPHIGLVQHVAFSPDGHRVLICSRPGPVQLWDARTGRLLLRWYLLRDGNWLAMTPQGYFTGSPGAGRHVRHRNSRTGELIPREESLRYHRPDLVARALQGR